MLFKRHSTRWRASSWVSLGLPRFVRQLNVRFITSHIRLPERPLRRFLQIWYQNLVITRPSLICSPRRVSRGQCISLALTPWAKFPQQSSRYFFQISHRLSLPLRHSSSQWRCTLMSNAKRKKRLIAYGHPPLFGTPPPFGKFHDFKGTAEPLASDSLATGFILL